MNGKKPLELPRGPVMADIAGTELDKTERERLCHPAVGSVILFSRNFESLQQLEALTLSIHELRDPPLLIAVDHEGGRVQRFRDGFTELPPMRHFGRLFDEDPKQAMEQCSTAGWLMAAELLELGVDFSFAPIADLDSGKSDVIGDRAFHQHPGIASDLAVAFMIGMRKAGMAATAKHFPGHGSVQGDSHHMLPKDGRSLAELSANDLVSFRTMIAAGVEGVMTAHVVYPQMDVMPPTFSSFWLKDMLRDQLGFKGLVFSDDLSMEGASVAGDAKERSQAALAAGCDVILLCNDTPALDTVLDSMGASNVPLPGERLDAFAPRLLVSGVRESKEWFRATGSLVSTT